MNPVDDAIAIWKAGVAAVEPRKLVREAFHKLPDVIHQALNEASQIIVVGGGKAGAEMAAGLEDACAAMLDKIVGLVNVPEGALTETRRIQLNPSRPAGSNYPTQAGVNGSLKMLDLISSAGPQDVAICLLSGGGSALMPAPVPEITLADKLIATKVLHSSGAGIEKMNCVRKHLSRIKGGRLADAFHGRWMMSLIISDVVGDPVDVIASGPTVPDPTTSQHALDMLDTYDPQDAIPRAIRHYIEACAQGKYPDTPKKKWPNVTNSIIGSIHDALDHSFDEAVKRGYRTTRYRDSIKGDLSRLVKHMTEIVSDPDDLEVFRIGGLQQGGAVGSPPAILFGGETTVTLGPNPGKGGRNQEFVLAMLCELGEAGMNGVTILSGGTDGEDGPTDAAGAIGTLETLQRARTLNLDPKDYLDRHDAYHFFEKTGGLFKTGLTGTNVMDLGVILLR